MAERVMQAAFFHPAKYIREEMRARGWQPTDVAARMGGDPIRNLLEVELYLAVQDPRLRLGDDGAARLARAFDVSPDLFLNLETAWLSMQEVANAR